MDNTERSQGDGQPGQGNSHPTPPQGDYRLGFAAIAGVALPSAGGGGAAMQNTAAIHAAAMQSTAAVHAAAMQSTAAAHNAALMHLAPAMHQAAAMHQASAMQHAFLATHGSVPQSYNLPSQQQHAFLATQGSVPQSYNLPSQQQHAFLATHGSVPQSYNLSQQQNSSSHSSLQWNAGDNVTPKPAGSTVADNCPSIAVAAMPNCGGGVLVLPELRKVYYYSLDFSKTLKMVTNPADACEFVNAYVAMELWKETLEKADVKTVNIKVDNTIDCHLGATDSFWLRVEDCRTKIGGKWVNVQSQNDVQRNAADQLSLAFDVDWDEIYPGYSCTSHDSNAFSILGFLKSRGFIPSKYLK